ncbi:mechanosensitive ion channel family protein [Sphingobium yanoikuyae]|nr:mechanosensitive ion channel family protein [Sphingobium yanoikuyae]
MVDEKQRNVVQSTLTDLGYRRCNFAARVAFGILMMLSVPSALAQENATVEESRATSEPAASSGIELRTEDTVDADIARRITSIFAQIDALTQVRARVSAGVVTLSGTVPTPKDIERAEAIAARVAGVVTVENDLERDLQVETNLAPALGNFGEVMRGFLRALPLIAIALGLAVIIGFAGHILASFHGLWRKITPNAFLADLIASLVRFVFIILGIIAGLELLGATALLGAVLGGAGVLGIAVGFAVRDTVDNYVSSLMLSLRQPFRANDHVVIEGNEGRVVRLTSRATILVTLDGNHLRIPNSTVFKAVILNYTRNPERRFEFDLGIDAADDPVRGMSTGLNAMQELDFVLDTPCATAVIHEVGDSNIVLRFFGWVDQRRTDFLRGRSFALQAVKNALEQAGFALPEPIYRLRFDETAPLPLKSVGSAKEQTRSKRATAETAAPTAPDASADQHIARLVDDERADMIDEDLLDSRRPIE